jgi:hypothetical protein
MFSKILHNNDFKHANSISVILIVIGILIAVHKPEIITSII